MYVVLTLVSIVPILVVWRMGRIYVEEGAELRARGQEQAQSIEQIPALRGDILDASGRVLVTNQTRYDLALDPTARGFADQASNFYATLGRLTGRSAGYYARKVESRSSKQYVSLATGVGEAEYEQLTQSDVPGLISNPTRSRRYTYGQVAAHVLGHVDRDGRGLAGLEVQYQEALEGVAGQQTVRRDRVRRRTALVDGARVEPKHGESLVLTLDLYRQSILEEELARGVQEAGSQWGAAVAIDPKTGAVLAMANVPTYNPNSAGVSSISQRRNRAMTDQLEPGSTFKLVAAAAALDEGVVRMEEMIETGEGWGVFSGRTLRDTKAHGTIPFSDVIAVSSNVGTARVAGRIDPDAFYQTARAMGFGQPTYIDLPGEADGRLKRPSEWSGTTRASMAIGYEVSATPLQVLAAYCALANGGLLVQPYVVSERRDVTGRVTWRAPQDSIRRAMSYKTAQALLPAFEKAVSEDGTARRAMIAGLPVAGKTGTARKAEGGAYGSGYRGSFVGFFPADDPQVALIVVMDEPTSSIYGGAVAAPVFQRTASRWLGTFPAIAARLSPPDSTQVTDRTHAPTLNAAPLPVASSVVRSRGLNVSAQRGFSAVHTTDADLVIGATVRALADTLEVETMPNLIGLTGREARYWLAEMGVRARITGSGVVASQSPSAGAPAPSRAVLSLSSSAPLQTNR